MRGKESGQQDRRCQVGGDLGVDSGGGAAGGIEERERALHASVDEDGVEFGISRQQRGNFAGMRVEVANVPLDSRTPQVSDWTGSSERVETLGRGGEEGIWLQVYNVKRRFEYNAPAMSRCRRALSRSLSASLLDGQR